MPRPSIEFLNARREHKHSRSGGTMQDHRVEYAPDSQLDPLEILEHETDTRCANMLLAVDAMRYRLFAQFGLVAEPETVDEIPF